MVIQLMPQYSRVDDQQHEKAIVYAHVAVKAMHIASTISPVGYLLMAALRRKQKYMRILRISNAALVPFFMGLTYYKLEMPEDIIKNKQRAFRLQRNLYQYYLEDWTCIGLVSGIALGLAIPRLGIVNSALLGSSLGFYSSVFILLGVRKGIVDPQYFDMTNLN